MASKQYIVFTGCGKTYFCKHNLNWVDLDIGWWDTFKDANAASNLFYFYPRWDYNVLIAGTLEVTKFIAYHKANTLNLLRPNFVPLKVNIILPGYDMKEEIRQRIESRGCPGDVRYLMGVYDRNYQAVDSMPFDTKVYLKPGQYLSDIIDEKGEYKPGIEVIYGNKQ